MKKELFYKENQQFIFNIIIPVFNAEKYIEKCLNSIKKQSYKNYQVKIIDDCSTDNSYLIIRSIIKKYKLLKIIIMQNKKQMGISYSLNKGIKIASKKIMF